MIKALVLISLVMWFVFLLVSCVSWSSLRSSVLSSFPHHFSKHMVVA